MKTYRTVILTDSLQGVSGWKEGHVLAGGLALPVFIRSVAVNCKYVWANF